METVLYLRSGRAVFISAKHTWRVYPSPTLSGFALTSGHRAVLSNPEPAFRNKKEAAAAYFRRIRSHPFFVGELLTGQESEIVLDQPVEAPLWVRIRKTAHCPVSRFCRASFCATVFCRSPELCPEYRSRPHERLSRGQVVVDRFRDPFTHNARPP